LGGSERRAARVVFMDLSQTSPFSKRRLYLDFAPDRDQAIHSSVRCGDKRTTQALVRVARPAQTTVLPRSPLSPSRPASTPNPTHPTTFELVFFPPPHLDPTRSPHPLDVLFHTPTSPSTKDTPYLTHQPRCQFSVLLPPVPSLDSPTLSFSLPCSRTLPWTATLTYYPPIAPRLSSARGQPASCMGHFAIRWVSAEHPAFSPPDTPIHRASKCPPFGSADNR